MLITLVFVVADRWPESTARIDRIRLALVGNPFGASLPAYPECALMKESDDVAAPWSVSQWINTLAPVSLEGLAGRVVMLHAFQMLCPACVTHAVPQAERVHRHFPSKDLAVVGLHSVFERHAAMTPVSLQAYLEEFRISHPIGVDAAGEDGPIPRTMRAYGMRGTPTLILFDRQGQIRLRHFGVLDDLILGDAIGRLVGDTGRTPEQSR